jgi:two-component system, OmpR family, heavy metal sensor histidine kinase CusS
VQLTIRARLTILYFVVLAASFFAFFWICDFGFQRSIETTVNDASRGNLESVRKVIETSLPQGIPKVQHELAELSSLWANGAIFEVASADGEWLFRSPRFLSPQFSLPAIRSTGVSFLTTNLELRQYRIARERVLIGGKTFLIDAAVPTEPFDQALDSFRLIEKEFLPLLVILASLLGYWLGGRALAPVNRIIQSAKEVGVQSLSRRLELPRAKDELRRLTETLNAMLDRIESSVKRITQFTADASHDLRTPLSLIRTNAELALRRPRTESEYRSTLMRILAASEESAQLIDHLLTLARADAGATQLNLQLAPLLPVLQDACQQGRLWAQAKGLDFQDSLSSEALALHMDASAMERLLLTLLDNAVKYTPTGGTVSLRAYSDERHAIVEITDSGIGIADSDLHHIFDRFYRADQARSREVPGSGLGLAIARWIADGHKATIEVESSLGNGALFRVRVPLADPTTVTEVLPKILETRVESAV